VVYSGLVQQHLRLLAREALARGDGPAFAAAYQEFERRLRLYPQFGDPQIDLTAEPGVIYLGITGRQLTSPTSDRKCHPPSHAHLARWTW
jgi:hypothetical protein